MARQLRSKWRFNPNFTLVNVQEFIKEYTFDELNEFIKELQIANNVRVGKKMIELITRWRAKSCK